VTVPRSLLEAVCALAAAPAGDVDPELTAHQIAELFGCSPNTVKDWCRKGEVEGAGVRAGHMRMRLSAFQKRWDDGPPSRQEPEPGVIDQLAARRRTRRGRGRGTAKRLRAAAGGV
jgi:hypothetical protein